MNLQLQKGSLGEKNSAKLLQMLILQTVHHPNNTRTSIKTDLWETVQSISGGGQMG